MKILALVAGFFLFSCQTQGNESNRTADLAKSKSEVAEIDYQKLDTATFAGGCFWCVEASFEQIRGVVEAVSG
ncbi:MAG: peptide-methionine (S)-S-oxide reductase, partial [Ekhidna sp.]